MTQHIYFIALGVCLVLINFKIEKILKALSESQSVGNKKGKKEFCLNCQHGTGYNYDYCADCLANNFYKYKKAK
ncbi:MAG: hypothetical protein A2X13_14630 [Bacteroidetes bacterium GWC2_33_15]|nr:MAG: hypothetical protein A2X10_12675 [Bacteroidetes bacterium GWA2_33_15]OFX50108.1 MAG: hypothetical protein A2X13_14630 [Bacteroidetes bacterium GWC2_33_15]OFX65261.1 MAG: hypothetical protein A2X15_04205 [Bacteroidetes bacterium GWB2_32_14]OFX70487.1 MAG: hypothetical protein A2X14_04260 [Bacteroidetes bacterium GWD2_33_33]HAN19640.1 hypothetical protein [Bacteroidales bacterium]